ncbi:MAG: hydrogenase [Nitrospirae bacterium]|nr:hydrogenase [Nitrospirota bacterium]
MKVKNREPAKQENNIYRPIKGTIERIKKQTSDVSLFTLELEEPVHYKAGQFFMVSVWGAGEVPISVTSLARKSTRIEFCIRRVGMVTGRIHQLKEGDNLWIRGPYGRAFPLELAKGRDVVIVAGGIGIAPLRPLIETFMKRKKYKVSLLYGSRSPDDIVYLDETRKWKQQGVNVVLTVDRPTDGWKGNVGLVTTLWHLAEVDFKKSVAFICGPEVMIRAAMQDLFFFGMPEERIITTLEAHMKCGVGKCGHCYAGKLYICKDGPVFSYKEIKEQSILNLGF